MLGNWTETISRRLVQWGRRPLKFGSLALLPIVLVALAACGNNADADPTPVTAPTTAPESEAATIVEIAVDDGRFETLVAALQAADLVETLEGPGPFTVFAPTDDAFAKLPEGTVEALLEDIPALTAILLYHVVPGNVMAADVVALDSATTVQGGTVAISVEGDTVSINDAQVVIADIEAANGTIHIIDTVLIPPVEEEEAAPEPQAATIVEIAVSDGRFETLVAALQAADLVETLEGPGPFTVFAPTDDAFAKLPEGTVEALLEDIPALTAILLYHVVPGNVMAADVVALDSATTVQGGTVAISVEGDTVSINDAQVVIADIEAANGTIHVIDTVLIPE
ncbi:MAG: fasciclin domain-containing protein [Caldilineaceae bacterium SB0661_bin_34]|nr:fasciclin domain-containing protein [Caldilineaceae bacterium SB0661_bin_34]